MSGARVIVGTGCTSAIGFAAIKQLLQSPRPHRFILGCRDTASTQKAFDALNYDTNRHSITLLQLELIKLSDVKAFAKDTLAALGKDPIDILFLNAGLSKDGKSCSVKGSKYNDTALVNHFHQHYLVHLLREKIEKSGGRIVFVSSGAIRMINDISRLDSICKANSEENQMDVYAGSKYAQLLGAQYWRRHLGDKASAIAVSPGLIPGTGLGRYAPDHPGIPTDHPDAKSIDTGAESLLRAFDVTMPADPERMWFTSWGEFWEKDVYQPALDHELQDRYCPTISEMEQEAKL